MKIKKLKIGQTYKSYKELCQELHESYKSGEAKKNQLEDWKRYFLWERNGNKYKIKKIYKEPKLKISMHYYRDIIKALILDLLIHNEEKNTYYISRNKLIQQLELVNDNFFYAERRQKRLSAYTSIPIRDIKDFYDSSNGLFKRNINHALNDLKDEGIIEYDTITYICECKPIIKNVIKTKSEVLCDEFGDSKEVDIIDGDVLKEFRAATDEELAKIVKIKGDLVQEYCSLIESEKGIRLKTRSVSQIIRYGFGEPFYKEWFQKLTHKLNIAKVYKVYKINYDKKNAIKQWEKECDALGTRSHIRQVQNANEQIQRNINRNAINRHNAAYMLPNNLRMVSTVPKKINRAKNDYVDNEFTLTKLLIDRNARLIIREMERLHNY